MVAGAVRHTQNAGGGLQRCRTATLNAHTCAPVHDENEKSGKAREWGGARLPSTRERRSPDAGEGKKKTDEGGGGRGVYQTEVFAAATER